MRLEIHNKEKQVEEVGSFLTTTVHVILPLSSFVAFWCLEIFGKDDGVTSEARISAP